MDAIATETIEQDGQTFRPLWIFGGQTAQQAILKGFLVGLQ